MDLSKNRLTGNNIELLIQYYGGNLSQLEILKLSNNFIRDFKCLETLKEFKNFPDGRDAVSLGQTTPLINLDLSENHVTEVKGYRQNIFERMLPFLEVLDGFDPDLNDDNSENDLELEEYDLGDRYNGGHIYSQ